MFIYQILAYSEAEEYVCFVEWHFGETFEAAVRHAMKWHPDLGKTKYKDVKFMELTAIRLKPVTPEAPPIPKTKAPKTTEADAAVTEATPAESVKIKPGKRGKG